MRKTFLISAIATFVLVGAVAAVAATMSITEANSAPKGTEATVSGTVQSVSANDFVLSDGTATIGFDCGPVWYKAVTLAVGDQVTVTGEIDRGKDGSKAAEVDAFSVTKAGETPIEVRPAAGKPPWAGAKGRGAGRSAAGGTKVEDNCNDVDKPDKAVDSAKAKGGSGKDAPGSTGD